jgi:phosphoglucomutase
LEALLGKTFADLVATQADEFSYRDPIDGSQSNHQGIRIWFEGGGRVVLRLSGTGTEGATLRIYLEQYRADGNAAQATPVAVLSPLKHAIAELSQMRYFIGRTDPDVVT